MSDQNKTEKELLLDHNYDGIQELDHPLPAWWLAILYLSAAFSVVYFIVYTFGYAPSLREVFAQDMQVVEEFKKQQGGQNQFNLEEYNALVANPEEQKKGEAVYTENCLSCHAEQGIGNIGPNMTDNYWIHAKGTPETLFKVAYVGVEEKGMPPWGEVLTKEDLYRVVGYLMTLKGKNLKGKEPQGELITGE